MRKSERKDAVGILESVGAEAHGTSGISRILIARGRQSGFHQGGLSFGTTQIIVCTSPRDGAGDTAARTNTAHHYYYIHVHVTVLSPSPSESLSLFPRRLSPPATQPLSFLHNALSPSQSLRAPMPSPRVPWVVDDRPHRKLVVMDIVLGSRVGRVIVK